MRLKKKIFEIGGEMTEKIEIKLLAPLYTWAVTIQCVPKKLESMKISNRCNLFVCKDIEKRQEPI